MVGYGADVPRFLRYTQDRDEIRAETADRLGLHVVRAYDDPYVIEGQGTTASELIEAADPLDVLVFPRRPGRAVDFSTTDRFADLSGVLVRAEWRTHVQSWGSSTGVPCRDGLFTTLLRTPALRPREVSAASQAVNSSK